MTTEATYDEIEAISWAQEWNQQTMFRICYQLNSLKDTDRYDVIWYTPSFLWRRLDKDMMR